MTRFSTRASVTLPRRTRPLCVWASSVRVSRGPRPEGMKPPAGFDKASGHERAGLATYDTVRRRPLPTKTPAVAGGRSARGGATHLGRTLRDEEQTMRCASAFLWMAAVWAGSAFRVSFQRAPAVVAFANSDHCLNTAVDCEDFDRNPRVFCVLDWIRRWGVIPRNWGANPPRNVVQVLLDSRQSSLARSHSIFGVDWHIVNGIYPRKNSYAKEYKTTQQALGTSECFFLWILFGGGILGISAHNRRLRR